MRTIVFWYLVIAGLVSIVYAAWFIYSILKNGFNKSCEGVSGLKFGGEFGLTIFSLIFVFILPGLLWPLLLLDIFTPQKWKADWPD